MKQVTRPLRDGWTAADLREVGEIVTGSTPPKAKTEYYGGNFPFVKPPELRHGPVNDAEDKLSDKGAEVADVAPTGTVLVSCIGNLGKTGLATRPVAFNQQINAIIPKDPKVSKWIFYAVQTSEFASQLASVASATTIAIVNKGKFSRLRIPLAPEEEQREIVAEIEKQFTRLEAGVAGLRRVQANLKRYRAAVLKAACEGKLVPTEAELARIEGRSYETGAQLLDRILDERRRKWNGKGKYKEPEKPETANLPPLPEGWVWATVEQLGQVQLGRQRSPKNVSRNYPTNYLRAANITEKGLNLSDVLDMEFRPDERERFRLRNGDIVLSEASGSPNQVGKPAMWRDELPLCCFQNTVIRHRPLIKVSSYLITVYRHFYFNGIFAQVAGGVGINHLSADKFSIIRIPLPLLAEQKRIVAEVERRLSVVEELEAVVNANLQRATRLRQSILQRAFSGQIV